ncbi:MAG: hypothetical protein RL226_568 [Bacteroidota bacterium]|jgi:O-succinylbenzoic acid--CoA ligase
MAATILIDNQIFSSEVLFGFPQDAAWKKNIYDALLEWQQESDLSFTTSGSTGLPKEVRFSRDLVKQSADATASFFGFNGQIRALLALPADKTGGKMMLYRALLGGWTLHCVEPTGVPEISAEFDFAAFTPHQLQRLLDERLKGLQSIKHILIGGAPVSQVLTARLVEHGLHAFESFGMTETLSHVALRKLSPVTSTVFEVIRPYTLLLDERGCAVVQIPGLEDVHTNDLIEQVSSTEFRWIGRTDFVINSGGVKIQAEEVERLLATSIPHPFYIGSVPHPTFGSAVVLVIEPGAMTEADIRAVCAKLKPTERPKEVIFAPIAMKNGKIIREIWS